MLYHNRTSKASTLLTIIVGSIVVLIGCVMGATEFMNNSGWETVNVTYNVSDCEKHNNRKTQHYDIQCTYIAEYSYKNKKYSKTLHSDDRRPSIFYIDTADPNKYLPYPPEGDYTMAILFIIAGVVVISIGAIQRYLKTDERRWEQNVEVYTKKHANDSQNTFNESQKYNINDLREFDDQKLK